LKVCIKQIDSPLIQHDQMAKEPLSLYQRLNSDFLEKLAVGVYKRVPTAIRSLMQLKQSENFT